MAGGAAPGSFFFDSSKSELLLAAPAGWQPSKSEVILPVNETLLRVKAGTKGVSFRDVIFEHAGWLGPNEPAGFVDDQAGTQVVQPTPPGQERVVLPNKTIPANVVVEGGKRYRCHLGCILLKMSPISLRTGAQGVLFDGCTFRHLGGAALHFQAGAQHSSVQRAQFHDVSASAVMIGNIVSAELPSRLPSTASAAAALCADRLGRAGCDEADAEHQRQRQRGERSAVRRTIAAGIWAAFVQVCQQCQQ